MDSTENANKEGVTERFRAQADQIVLEIEGVALGIEIARGTSHSVPSYGNWSIGYSHSGVPLQGNFNSVWDVVHKEVAEIVVETLRGNGMKAIPFMGRADISVHTVILRQ